MSMLNSRGLLQKITQALLNKTENPDALQCTRRQFLPAALEVADTPANPTGRAILKVIGLLFVLALLWACFGKVDIVATAQGKIVPSERVKTIQPMVIGEIKAIHVKEGDEVQVGDPLITLDSTVTQAELARLTQNIELLELQLARQQAFTGYLDNAALNKASTQSDALVLPTLTDYLPAPATATIALNHHQPMLEQRLFEQRLLEQQVRDYQTARATLDSQFKSKQAEARSVAFNVTKLKRVLPIISERTEALKGLFDNNHGSKVAYLELEQQRIELEETIKAQHAQVEQLQAEQEEIKNQQHSLHAQKRRESLDQQEQLHQQLTGLIQEQIKARELYDQQQLQAPIDGTVQQLQIHTIGGVVQPAQALMQIVPKTANMEVEAWVLNKDIGFVQEGQKAEVKIDTFNFTKYGLIEGRLTTLSNDAVPDEKLGLRYLANVHIQKDWMQVENRKVNLAPGMSVAVEIKTGQRRLIEYFLSPLLRFKQESVRER